jgi:hypothetical protein
MDQPNCCNIYEGADLPPCTKLLNGDNPLIKEGRLIFRNYNRVYFFISASTKPIDMNELTPMNTTTIITNVQISLCTFIIGLFLSQILCNTSKYDPSCTIHQDPKINSFIHESIKNPPNLNFNLSANLTFLYSNSNAILHPFIYTKVIPPLAFFILFVINRAEDNPGLFFINNSYVTEDTINFILSELNIQCPFNQFYNDQYQKTSKESESKGYSGSQK